MPAYEGWERNPDGSFNIIFGTMNRNWGGRAPYSDRPGQQHRARGTRPGAAQLLPASTQVGSCFACTSPADFGEKELVWTLSSPNGETKRAYGTLKPDYFVDNSVINANNGAGIIGQLHKNLAPALALEGALTRRARVGEPLTLTALSRDPDSLPPRKSKPPSNPRRPSSAGAPNAATGLRLSWFVYRGAGGVRFDPPQIKVWEDTRENSNSPWGPGWETPDPPPDNTWVVRATFSEPGSYVLRCQAHDGGLSTTEDVTVTVTR